MVKNILSVVLTKGRAIFNLIWQNKKWRIISIVVLLLLVLIFIAKARGGFINVETAKAAKGKILSTVSASGVVESKSVKLGSAAMAGRVDWVGVNEGDRVRRGQILIKLNGYNQAYKEYRRLEELHANGYVSDMELERAKTAVDNAAIISPIAGLVTDKAITLGEAVSVGLPVMTVVDIDNPWAEIQIDEVDIAKVSLGQKVEFTTDAYQDKEFYGSITWLNKEAELKKVGGRVRMDEENLVFRAKVKFDSDVKDLKPGMSVYAEVMTGEKDNILIVPRAAVTLYDGKKVVYLVKGSRAKRQIIEVGAKDISRVEITKGVSEGELVVVSELDKMKNNSKIKIAKKKNGNDS